MGSAAPAVPAVLPEPLDVPSGLPGLPRVAWGTHLCQFYRTTEDLASTLVPYFAAGLANDERCLWITAEPLRAADARRALAGAVPDLEERARRGQIEVIDYDEWYLQNARLTTDEILGQWLAREEAALRDGCRGLRITGNTSWLRREHWKEFEAYERSVHAALAGRRVLAVCSYPLAQCTTEEVLDVVRHHGMALARRDGEWAMIRSATETLAAVVQPAGPGDHDAVLYRREQFPAERVAGFVAEGLRRGEAAVVVLGGERDRAVRAALRRDGIDLDAALRAGQVAWVDPEELLPRLLREGAVDPARFAALVPPLLSRARERFGSVRVYGELVDLLARRGAFEAAIGLERLWNALLERSPAPVLCTYDARVFAGADGPRRLREVQSEHRHVHATDPEPHAAALRGLVTELAAKTRALEAEASRRSAAERERDRWKAASGDARSHVMRLQQVTSALLPARSAADLGAVVVTTMAEAAGASSALLAAATPGAALELVAHTGCPPALREAPGPFALDAASPLQEVLRTGRPVVLGEELLAARWPGAAGTTLAAYVALPLEAGGVRRGALAFGFSRTQAFSAADQAFFDDLARQAAMSLERAQLLVDVEQARERAEEASRAKDEFLAMLGHELRNPLSPMLTVLHLMARRAPDAFRSERGILERQLRHMEHLVDDLLDVARIVRGKLALKRERVELGGIVADALESASPLLEARRHHVEVKVPPAGLAVDADRHRLVQAVLNLLTNAAKYTPPGGHVWVSAEACGGVARLVVADDGQGLEPELAPRVFELFVQGPRGLARSEGGLGLGLAIARSVVEMHGGAIHARSDGRGTGSTFVIELPLAPAATAPAPPAREAPARAASSARRVLVVDDNADGAETLADLLRCSGYAVRTAHDAPTALAVAAELLPEVAIIDIGLPGVDGWVLAERLRAQQAGNPPHCVAVTGYGMETDRARSRELGFVAHLVKPLEIERLERILAGLVAAREAGGRD